MRKLFVSLALVLSITTATAQDNEGQRRQQPQVDRTEMMVKEYGLDAAQTEKLKELNEKYADLFRFGRPGGMRGGMPGGMAPGARPEGGQVRAPQEGQVRTMPEGQRPPRPQGGDFEKRMQERREKMEAYEKELKEIMTESQYEAYQKRNEEMRRNRPQFGGRQ